MRKPEGKHLLPWWQDGVLQDRGRGKMKYGGEPGKERRRGREKERWHTWRLTYTKQVNLQGCV